MQIVGKIDILRWSLGEAIAWSAGRTDFMLITSATTDFIKKREKNKIKTWKWYCNSDEILTIPQYVLIDPW